MQIPGLIFTKYFAGKRARGLSDESFMGRINAEFVCFTTTVLFHTLRPWRTGVYTEPADFKKANVEGLQI
jgi:hypothetical protein